MGGAERARLVAAARGAGQRRGTPARRLRTGDPAGRDGGPALRR